MLLPNKDPLGAAIVSYWQGNKKAAIKVYSDQADPDKLPVSYLFRTLNKMPAREKFALSLCKGKTLDVGAGAGSHALALQEKGIDVTALEISEQAVGILKERGVRKVLIGDFLHLPPQPFDTLLLLMNGAGLAGSLDGLEDFLIICKNWLAPQGQILLESSDILYLYEEEDGSYLIDLNGAYYGELTYVMEFGKERSDPFKWLFVDFGLLAQTATLAGFTSELILQEEDAHYLARLTLADDLQ